MNVNVNIVFCGKRGSGKTTISKLVAANLGAKWNSFGSTVKRIAIERGISISVQKLQELGEMLILQSPEQFCRRVISEAEPVTAPNFVLDGLRHGTILGRLREIVAPSVLMCIFIAISEDVRLKRLALRDRTSTADILRLDAHTTEVEVDSLLRIADFAIENETTPELTAAHCLDAIKHGDGINP